MLRQKSASALAAILLLSASLAACSKPAEEAPMAEETMPADAAAETAPTVEDAPSGPKTEAPSIPQLAYDYSFGLSAPEKGLQDMVTGHQDACTIAGSATCQVLSLNTRTGSEYGQAQHTLVLRATPQWIGLFRKNLTNELKAVGGQIETQQIATEDLSVAMIDREAHIKNQIALRDNLQQTLRTHKGKLAEVADIRRELAEVQSGIDAAQTALATMKKRVAMSQLTLTYTPTSAVAMKGTWAPFSAAIGNLGPNFVSVLTVLITVFGYLLPIGLVAAPVAWWVRRNRNPKAAPKTIQRPGQA
ncbi:DUF4349 domain-containing protein [Asticcacaulis sp. YBE204]|uniref:DUF4349 domain-containing protein n=1 Tax=Asticcacaulis sp. YBE204 TaxID=1282363 RepID=UPI0003C3D369|nr:DUF4349 domain-containing protein [Asticcacaulis sp. YBE204]ESQ78071.1 hypothetical protein AEYBE204_16380 [Asticcacaulis sp. YBE204]